MGDGDHLGSTGPSHALQAVVRLGEWTNYVFMCTAQTKVTLALIKYANKYTICLNSVNSFRSG